ncbi:MAG: DUF998 domain-containing protein [Thermoplasmata archaeon]
MNKLYNLLGVVGGLYTIIFVYISTIISPNFSWVGNYLSDIGAGQFGNTPALIFNSTLIIGGIILAIFFLLSLVSVNGIVPRISLLIMFIGSLSLSLIGVFTENSPFGLHKIFSYGFFLLLPIAMIIFSFHYFRKKTYFGLFTILMAIVALGIIMDLPFGGGKAIPEIGEALILSIWVIVFSILQYMGKLKKIISME